MIYFTCSQSAIPETVVEVVSMMNEGHYTRPARHASFEEARRGVHQTGRHNIILQAQKNGTLKIVRAMWDSQ